MVELLLAGLVLGLSSASVSGLFIASGMQFYRACATIESERRRRYPTTTGYHKLIPQDKIPSNLLEITVLGPDMSMQFIGTKVGISTRRAGETVILPGYRPELALTDDAVIRLELVNSDNFSTSYKTTASQGSSQSAETAKVTMYLASSQGCMTTAPRPSADGSSGTEVTIVTELQWKTPITALETTSSQLSATSSEPLRYDAHAILGFSTESLLEELSTLTPPKTAYDAKVARHVFRQVRAAKLTKLASESKGTSGSSTKELGWTCSTESTPNFLSPETPDEVFYEKVTAYTALLR